MSDAGSVNEQECPWCGAVEEDCYCPDECSTCGGEIEGWKLGRLCETCERAEI